MKLRALLFANMVLFASSAQAQPPSRDALSARLSRNYALAREARIGVFRMPEEQKRHLDIAHARVQRALSTRDDAAFRTALRGFWNIPIEVVRGRAALARGFSHGSGNGGSSNTFAKGVSDGAAIGTALADKAKVHNAVICTYFFGAGPRSCDFKLVDRIYERLAVDAVSPSGLERVLGN